MAEVQEEMSIEDLVDANTYEETNEITPDDVADEIEAEVEDTEADEEDSEDAETSADADEEEAEDEAESVPIESLDTLAEALEKPIDEVLDTIKGKVTINGEIQEVTLGEALKGYQRQVDYENNTRELKEHKTHFEAERAQVSQMYLQKLNEADGFTAHIREALIGEMNTPQVQALAASPSMEDRLRYQELLNEHTQRVAQFQQFSDQITSERQQQAQQLQQQQAAQYQQMIGEQSKQLQQAWPEFGPTKQAEMYEFLYKEYGLNQQEVSSVTDHRMYLVVRDAMKAKAVKDETNIAKKKVAKLPGLQQKPKKSMSKKQKSALAGGRLAKQAKKTGSLDDAANWLDGSGIDF